ncbi:SH3 domain-containing protein [Phormidium sp. CLA17]|uniref:SH3 domain-containing protein n=1 Tax=Leptolyngbya sp. Cla-17 TaxID=2803751 RepID=UPI0014930C52|nr:SH3 domain-containing protein [Leptolyngbya sp. Cla-17]MBM0743021.1 SH3 domain-containing protein [Leptolyngbya sp. Cla-17]
MNGSGLLKALSGCLVAIALIAGGGFLAAQYLIAQFTTPPPKPMFVNDKPTPKPQPTAIATKPKPPQSKTTPSATPSPKPSGEGYQARITLSEGLNVRSNPAVDSDRVGGIDFDEEVTVLEETPNQEWQRVRVKTSNVEGWIKSGYTERIN